MLFKMWRSQKKRSVTTENIHEHTIGIDKEGKLLRLSKLLKAQTRHFYKGGSFKQAVQPDQIGFEVNDELSQSVPIIIPGGSDEIEHDGSIENHRHQLLADISLPCNESIGIRDEITSSENSSTNGNLNATIVSNYGQSFVETNDSAGQGHSRMGSNASTLIETSDKVTHAPSRFEQDTTPAPVVHNQTRASEFEHGIIKFNTDYALRRHTMGILPAVAFDKVLVEDKTLIQERSDVVECSEDQVWKLVLEAGEIGHRNEVAAIRDEHADELQYLQNDLEKVQEELKKAQAFKCLLQKRVKKEVEAKAESERQQEALKGTTVLKDLQLANLNQTEASLQTRVAELQKSEDILVSCLGERQVQAEDRDREIVELRERISTADMEIQRIRGASNQSYNHPIHAYSTSSLPQENEQLRELVKYLQIQMISAHRPQLPAGYTVHNKEECLTISTQRQDLQQRLDEEQTANIKLAVNLVKMRNEAQFYFTKLVNLQEEIEGERPDTTDIDQLIAEKDHRYCELEKRAGHCFVAYEKLDKQSKKDIASAQAELSSLRYKLDVQIEFENSMKARKDTLQKLNRSLLNDRFDGEEFIELINADFQTTRQQNQMLETRYTEIENAMDLVQKDNILYRSRHDDASNELAEKTKEISELENSNRAMDIEIGRLEAKVGFADDAHGKDLEAKDALIADLKLRVKHMEEELSSIDSLELSEKAEAHYIRQHMEIANLKAALEQAHEEINDCKDRESSRVWVEGIEEYSAIMKEESDRLFKERLTAAEEEVETLQKQSGELKVALIVAEELATEEKENATVLKDKLDLERLQAFQDLEVIQRLRKKDEGRLADIGKFAADLWKRVMQVEGMLEMNGFFIFDNDGEREEFMRASQALLELPEMDCEGEMRDEPSLESGSGGEEIFEEPLLSLQIPSSALSFHAYPVYEDRNTNTILEGNGDTQDDENAALNLVYAEGEAEDPIASAMEHAKQLIAKANLTLAELDTKRKANDDCGAYSADEATFGGDVDVGDVLEYGSDNKDSVAGSEASTVILARQASLSPIKEEHEVNSGVLLNSSAKIFFRLESAVPASDGDDNEDETAEENGEKWESVSSSEAKNDGDGDGDGGSTTSLEDRTTPVVAPAPVRALNKGKEVAHNTRICTKLTQYMSSPLLETPWAKKYKPFLYGEPTHDDVF